VARGCALQAAILSPLYKVRDFKVEDTVPSSITFTWQGSASVEDKDGDAAMEDKEKEAETTEKQMMVFDEKKDKMDTKKYITWKRDSPFGLQVGYTGATTEEGKKELGEFKVDLAHQPEKKKVKIEAKVNQHGVFALTEATLVEIEEYEETVKEKREIVEEEPEKPAADAAGEGEKSTEEKKEGEAAEGAAPSEEKKDADMADAEGEKKEEAAKTEEKPAEKKKEVKYEWVDVKKPKKRTKRTPLNVIPSERPGLKADAMQAQKDAESLMQTETREVKDNDDKRNDVETYIYKMKDELVASSGKCHEYMKADEREKFSTQLTAAEDWLYDNFDATTLSLCDKLQELEEVGAPATKRFEQRDVVKEYIPKCQDAIKTVRAYVNNMSADYEHIAQSKKNAVVDEASALEAWISEQQMKEAKNPLHEDAVFLLKDLKEKEEALRVHCNTVMREPKPAPVATEERPAEEAAAEAEKPDEEMKESAPEGGEAAAEGAGTEGEHKEAPAAEGSSTTDPLEGVEGKGAEAPAAETEAPAGAGMEVD